MLKADRWKDYELLDTCSGEKLERWGDYLLVRPDPQVLWDTGHSHVGWKKKNAHYHRSNKGGGEWEFLNLPDEWTISYALPATELSPLCFHLKPFAFKHTGLFPEQAVNWDFSSRTIRSAINSGAFSDLLTGDSSRPVKVLNLFAYTGGATVAAAASGAQVTHVDAAKGMVAWAKENAASSKVPENATRWIVDDCVKFVEREIRRGHSYDAILMDPPSYGRGPKGEIWKLEEQVWSLISLTAELLSDTPLFFLINSYTTGLQPGVLQYMLDKAISEKKGGHTESTEIGLPLSGTELVLPCGACARWIP